MMTIITARFPSLGFLLGEGTSIARAFILLIAATGWKVGKVNSRGVLELLGLGFLDNLKAVLDVALHDFAHNFFLISGSRFIKNLPRIADVI